MNVEPLNQTAYEPLAYYIYIHNMNIRVYIYIYLFIYICIYIYMCVCVNYIHVYIYINIYIISVEKAAPTGTSLNTCEQVQLFSQLKQIVPSRQVVEAHPLATGLQKSLEDLPAGPGS